MSMNIRKSFSNTAKTLALGTVLSLSTVANDVMAESPASASSHSANSSSVSHSAPVQKKTPFELAEIAGKYSEENNGIGMFINVAPGTRYTPQQIGDALVRKFAKEGIESEYTFNYASKGNSTVSFFVRGIPYTGYGLGMAKEGFEVVSKTFHALEAKDIASNDLAYNHN